jgi:hypothetical protein
VVEGAFAFQMTSEVVLAIITAVVTVAGGGALAKSYIESLNKRTEARISQQSDEIRARIQDEEYERARSALREDRFVEMLQQSLATLKGTVESQRLRQERYDKEFSLLLSQLEETGREQNVWLSRLVTVIGANGEVS